MSDTKRTRNDRLNRKSDNEDYRYEIVHTETMSEQDLDSLAMCIANCIYEDLRRVAIGNMRGIFPDFNPINDPSLYKGEAVEIDEATMNRYTSVTHCKMNFTKYPGIVSSLVSISFDVVSNKTDFDEGESE